MAEHTSESLHTLLESQRAQLLLRMEALSALAEQFRQQARDERAGGADGFTADSQADLAEEARERLDRVLQSINRELRGVASP